jgi:hypothetical protein
MHVSRTGRTLCLVLAIVSAGAMPCFATTPDSTKADKQLSEELLTNLRQFATKHSLNDQQLRLVLERATLSVPGFNEGGIGVIGHGTFVVLDKGPNSLSIRLNKNGRPVLRAQWRGAAQSRPQLVITDGKKVVWQSNALDFSNWTVVMFTPREVHYIDVPIWVGGSLAREQ